MLAKYMEFLIFILKNIYQEEERKETIIWVNISLTICIK